MAGQWAPDPSGRHQLRYWDGSRWTSHVSTDGVVAVDDARVLEGDVSPRSDAPAARELEFAPSVAAAHQPTPNDDFELWWSTPRKGCTYLGSHPRFTGSVPGLTVALVSDGVAVLDRKNEVVRAIGWDSVVGVRIESADNVRRRVTATRLVLFGGLALLAKKEQRTAYLSVVEADGEWVFAVQDVSSMDLWQQLLPTRARVPHKFIDSSTAPTASALGASPSAGSLTTNIEGRLDRLVQLHESGAITSAEYASRRAAILDEI